VYVKKSDKERVVSELAERLKSAATLIVADYRGLTMPQIDALRGQLLEHGARFAVVKNTLTRRAAEAAGVDALLALLEGPTAIAFLETDGDPVEVAKALSTVARQTQVLVIRGGIMEGRTITGEDVQSLAKLPPADVLRAQVVGAIAAPMSTVVGLFNAPLRDLVGVVQARIDQLEEQGGSGGAPAAEAVSGSEPQAAESPEAPATNEAPTDEPDSGSEPQSPESVAGSEPAEGGEG
jgi:large subunit ribosomal protein L10